MKTIKVWAPKAKKVSLVVNDKETAMKPDKNGFWQQKIKAEKSPLLYGFKVDGEGPFPDPKSEFQPEGVHGLSQKWPDNFKWQNKNCVASELAEAVIYELHTGTFTPEGTFTAIIDKLDYLKELGVTHIELLPVAAFPGHHGWGYDGVSLFATHKEYGTPDDLKKLVDACHGKDMGIILDVVYNHLGPDGNYLGLYGHYFSDRYHTPWGEAVNFDWAHSDQVREFVIENALRWLEEFNFDGLRLDAVHAIYDFSATHILEELQTNLEKLEEKTGQKYFLIAESDLNDPRLLHSREKGGYGLAAQWMDDFHHSIHVMFTGEQQNYYLDFKGAKDLNKCLKDNFVYDGVYSPSRKRKHGRKADDLKPEHFVVSIQNHDQVGNRALGERLNHLTGFSQCQLATALMLLSPFVPMLFQGEEWAASTPFLYFTDHTDEKLARAVKRGRQREYPSLNKKVPDPQAPETFKRSTLIWNEQEADQHKKMLDWYKELIKLRKNYLDDLRKQTPEFKQIKENLYFYQNGSLVMFANTGNDKQKFNLQIPELKNCKILLQNNNNFGLGNEIIAGADNITIARL
jgi:maltooligosyltrehalose trehalohydrolase